MGGPLTIPRVSWSDFADDDVKGYFCRRPDGQFVAYLNWAACADLQLGLHGLATEYAFHEDVPIPFDGFEENPVGAKRGEMRIGHNEVVSITDDEASVLPVHERVRYDDREAELHAGAEIVAGNIAPFFVLAVSHAEAYEAFLNVRGLPETKTAMIFGTIRLEFVPDATTDPAPA